MFAGKLLGYLFALTAVMLYAGIVLNSLREKQNAILKIARQTRRGKTKSKCAIGGTETREDATMLTAFWKNRMAARVALEIERLDRDPKAHEGLAYLAEWDERGSDALKHIASRALDVVSMRVSRRLGLGHMSGRFSGW